MSEAMLNAMIAAGPSAMIANVSTALSQLVVGGRLMPFTRDDGEIGGSYVCRPHSAYVLYAREELGMVDIGWIARPARLVLTGLDALLKSAQINRIVHLGNWMLSTNLHDGWRGEGLAAAREALIAAHPDHLLGVRSVDDWSSPGLRQALAADGWILVPSRQIWVVDDLARGWRPRHNYDNDRRLVARSALRIQDLPCVAGEDARRIAELYEMLYVGRYSALNPILTPAFIETAARTGMIAYRVARDPDGVIMSVAGMWERGGVMTPPVVGYDTTRPRRDGLYRMASWMFMDRALEAGWRLHGSAGAAHFKRQRGAQGVIEWNAYYARHLTTARRLAVKALAAMLTRLAVPLMVAKQW
jgi:hypothetical protein